MRKTFIATNHNSGQKPSERNMLCVCGSTFGFTLALGYSLQYCSSWVSEAAAALMNLPRESLRVHSPGFSALLKQWACSSRTKNWSEKSYLCSNS